MWLYWCYWTLLHDTIQVQRRQHANISTLHGRIVPLYLLSQLAQLTIYGTTAKWPICISGHWYIFNCAASASNWGDCWRLAGVAPGTYCREYVASFLSTAAKLISLLATWFKYTSWIATYLACMATCFLYTASGENLGCHDRCINFTALSLTFFMTLGTIHCLHIL